MLRNVNPQSTNQLNVGLLTRFTLLGWIILHSLGVSVFGRSNINSEVHFFASSVSLHQCFRMCSIMTVLTKFSRCKRRLKKLQKRQLEEFGCTENCIKSDLAKIKMMSFSAPRTTNADNSFYNNKHSFILLNILH